MAAEETLKWAPKFIGSMEIAGLAAEIGETIGRMESERFLEKHPAVKEDYPLSAALGTLILEDSDLTLDDMKALARKNETEGLPRAELEAMNALKAYSGLSGIDPGFPDDVLRAHGVLTKGLLLESGCYRSGNMGIYYGNALVHEGAPAREIAGKMERLCQWARETRAHPLVRACVFHYELEYIYPFADGNGPLGRLCQAAILAKWKPLLQYAPVEAVLARRKRGYLNALIRAENREDGGEFVLFMLEVIRDALEEMQLIGGKKITGSRQAPVSGNNGASPKEDGKDRLLSFIRSAPGCTQEELAGMMEKSPRTVRAMMREMQEEGVIRREGARKNGVWVISGEEQHGDH